MVTTTTSPSRAPTRAANAPVATLPRRDPVNAAPGTARPMVRVLQANRAPAQLTLFLRPPAAPTAKTGFSGRP